VKKLSDDYKIYRQGIIKGVTWILNLVICTFSVKHAVA